MAEVNTPKHTTEPSPSVNEANKRSSASGLRIAGLTLLLCVLGVGGWLFYQTQLEEPVEIVVAAGPVGSDSHQLMQDISKVVARHSSFVRLKIEESGDSSFNIGLLDRRQVDMATIQDTTPVVSDVRLVTNLFADYFQVMVRDETRARAIEDFDKIKIAIPGFGTSAYLFFWAVADHYDFSPSDIDWVALDFEAGAKALLAGEVDALFFVKSVRDRNVLDLVQKAGLQDVRLRYLSIDQAPAMALKRPLIGTGTILAGALDGRPRLPTTDITTASAQRVLVAHQSVPSEAIEDLTRILFEFRLELTSRIPLSAQIAEPDRTAGFNVPLHEGARWFYERDKPTFLQENSEVLALFVTLTVIAFSVLSALRKLFDTRRKNRADSFNYELLELSAKARTADSLAQLINLRDQHAQVLERVVSALDTDAVTEDGFHSFTVTWESVGQIIRDQINEHRAKA